MALINNNNKVSIPGNSSNTIISENTEDIAERTIEASKSKVQDNFGNTKAPCLIL